MRTVCLLGLLLTTLAATADSLYTPTSGFAQLFSDRRAVKVGDILHIVITEVEQASQSMTDATASKTDAAMGPGTGLLNFIPLIGYNGSISADSKGSTNRTNSFNARIAVTVVGVAPNGNLLVEGSREVRVHKDFEVIKLTGEVRPQDVGADNTVPSYRVANAQISSTGSNPLHPGNKVGIITRMLHWLF
jgi:flagellar L-ring protein FlgH